MKEGIKCIFTYRIYYSPHNYSTNQVVLFMVLVIYNRTGEEKSICMRRHFSYTYLNLLFVLLLTAGACAPSIQTSHLANGWARTPVNTTYSRKHALYSHDGYQYTAFYDNERSLILAKRPLGTFQWLLQRTPYKGNAFDAYNSISLIVDQAGYVHVAWDHHHSYLRYARSIAPGSLTLGEEESMVGTDEKVITYPEFHALRNGGLLFAYRSAEAGEERLVLNTYDLTNRQWTRVHDRLLGEGNRIKSWSMATSKSGTIHMAWIGKGTDADSAAYHIGYAKSTDAAITWTNSSDQVYPLPISYAEAEMIGSIPVSSPVNRIAITSDHTDHPMVAGHWKDTSDAEAHYKILHYNGDKWQYHATDFSKSSDMPGVADLASPAQVVVDHKGNTYLIFRETGRSNKISIASSPNLDQWKVMDLTSDSFPNWEPSLDPAAWLEREEIHLFIQNTLDLKSGSLSRTAPTSIKVLEWKARK